MRTCACFGAALHIIEPCGFVFDLKKLRQSGLDYVEHVTLFRHTNMAEFQAKRPKGRLVLLTTKTTQSIDAYQFTEGDTLLLGRESAGVPEEVAACADATLRIPMRGGMRSLNVAQSAAIGLYAAMQTMKGRA